MKPHLAIFCLAVALSACAPEQRPAPPTADTFATAESGALRLSEGWAAASPGGVRVAAGYVTIANMGEAPDALIGASSPRAPSVEIHTMAIEGGMMTMRPAGDVAVPARGAIVLAPGGLHIMFMEIDAPFTAGEAIPLTLRFERAGDVALTLPVRQRGAGGGPAAPDTHQGH